MVNNKNLFRESVVFGNFVNCDDIKTGGNQANAKFKRNVLIGGDLTLGLETSTTTSGVTTYTDTGGNILVKINGITYTLTPTKIKHLSTISSDIQTQINNITSPDLSSYAPKASPTFTGTPLAPTPLTTDDSTKIATTAFVKAQGYLTTTPDLSSYATKASPTFTGDVIIGQTGSDNLTINSKIYAKNGIVYPTLVYTTYTTEYNRFFGNFIMFYNFASSSGSQLLPSIPTGTNSSTIKFYNNNEVTLTLTSQNTSLIYGLLGSGYASISLLPKYFYELTSMFSGGGAYDNWLVTSAVNSQYQLVDIGTTQTIGGTKTFSIAPLYTGTYPDNDNSTKLATTSWVRGQGYVLSSSFSLFELQGDYNGRKNPSYTINSYEATYDFVGDNIGYSSIINAFTTTRGSFIREHYWDDNNFTFPQSGKYLINITFYIKSNTAGNKFMLKQFNSNNDLIFSQYCLVEGNISSDTIRTYSTILNATSGGYFNLPMTNKVGTTTLYFYKTEYTNMKIMLLSA